MTTTTYPKCPRCQNILSISKGILRCLYCERPRKLTLQVRSSWLGTYYKVLESINLECIQRSILTPDEVKDLAKQGILIKLFY